MTRYTYLIPVAMGLLAISCQREVVRTPSNVGELCAFPADTASARAIQWAAGCDNLRTPVPPNSSASILFWEVDERGNPVKQIRELCTAGQSLLPVGDGGKLYLVNASLLYSVDPRTGHTEPVIATGVGSWQFSRILGFSKNSGKFEVLVEMLDERAIPPKSLWLLTMDGTTAGGIMLGDQDPRIQDPGSMEQHFLMPRCKDGYHSCLVVTQSRGFGIEPQRGQPIMPLEPLPSVSALDAKTYAKAETGTEKKAETATETKTATGTEKNAETTAEKVPFVVIDTSWVPDQKQMVVLAKGCSQATKPAASAKLQQ